MVLSDKQIGFVGAGAIAEALVKGLLDRGAVRPDQLTLTNRANRERLESLSARYGVDHTNARAELIAKSDVIVLACKPKDVPAVLAEIGPVTRQGQVLLSVVAGVSTASLSQGVSEGVAVVRAMPNTSCLVGESATAIALAEGAGGEARAIAEAILSAVGQVVEVEESQLDAVTGLSGSGPAYVYLLTESMIEAGAAVGLSEAVARTLVVQTLLGAARMLAETGEDPAVLRARVTSPNGTTVAGLKELQEAGFVEAMVRAVTSATKRSRELGLAAVPLQAAGD